MAVSMRLIRKGKKKLPFYRIVVQDQDSAPKGSVLEELGTHDPMKNPPVTQLKTERIQEWLSKGAIPTATVQSLLKKHDCK